MRFSTISAALALAATSIANSVLFKSLDNTTRTIYFTPNAGLKWLDPVDVPGGSEKKVEIPHGWIGNWYAIAKGESNLPGMLGEVAFDGWNGLTYFDVSAIVNPAQHTGVKEMWPATGLKPTSGCKKFPCNNAYYLPDDVQTKTTPEKDLVCTLGEYSDLSARDVDHEESPSVARKWVLGGL